MTIRDLENRVENLERKQIGDVTRSEIQNLPVFTLADILDAPDDVEWIDQGDGTVKNSETGELRRKAPSGEQRSLAEVLSEDK